MLGARVTEAAMHSRFELFEGRSLIDRNGDCAGGGIVRLPGVDCQCVEAVHVSPPAARMRRTLMLLTWRGEKLQEGTRVEEAVSLRVRARAGHQHSARNAA